MSLPPEIVSCIVSVLPKSTLKTMRLLCRSFYDGATPLLFSSVFVSARHVDREIAELVASRFPSSITTLTFSSECLLAHDTRCVEESPPCGKSDSHLGQARLFHGLRAKLGSEGREFHDSGAVQAQLVHLLNTLPNLQHVILTDRRRRQDLSWLQEASLRQVIQRFAEPTRFGRFRRALADLLGLPDRTKFREPCVWDEDVRTLAQLQLSGSIHCKCWDREPIFSWLSFGLGQAGSYLMPENPWAEIMKALHDSTNVSTHTISIQPTKAGSYLPFRAIESHVPDIVRSTTFVIPRMTELELHLDGFGNHVDLEKMHQILQDPTKFLSTASNLSSLTINFLPSQFPTEKPWPPSWPTTFAALLEGCQLPRLSLLHLRNFTFREAEFSTFIQRSPHIHDLSLQNFHMINHKDLMPLTNANLGSWKRLLLTIKKSLQHLEHFRVRSATCYYELNLPVRRSAHSLEMDVHWKHESPRFMFDDGIDPFAEIIEDVVLSREWE